MTTTHSGSCHCGRVAFDVDGAIDGGLACNCSMCQRKGSLLWFVPREHLRLKTPDETASSYTFNQHRIRHRFCPTCGIHPYAEATGPDGQPMAAVNLRCIEGIDLASIPVREYDGRSA
ncbi:GFA family protein [Piscinibacter koreensis]|uniref:GFA family protein n=1 Tax=Piscinibacter koreensis TaxID=2742824 RepID=A0A7Y6TVQ1_9BURK|nr:GFA family protein [Schlegelella koreensis]NUZ05344.1 GFA family protein [Schlegelella koreensis]